MPYMKGDDKDAISIHMSYESKGDQLTFLKEAREFLFRKKFMPANNKLDSIPIDSPSLPPKDITENGSTKNPAGHNLSTQVQSEKNQIQSRVVQQQQQQSMEILERKMTNLISDDDNALKLPLQRTFPTSCSNGMDTASTPMQQKSMQIHPVFNSMNEGITESSPDKISQIMEGSKNKCSSTDILSSLFSTSSDKHFQESSSTTKSSTSDWPLSISPSTLHPTTPPPPIPLPGLLSTDSRYSSPTKTPMNLAASSLQETPSTKDAIESTPSKPKYQPKRVWTHVKEQPGKVLANNYEASIGFVADLRPRQELTARWMLPIRYLKENAEGKDVQSVRDLLKYLSVGLFRRGCTENGFPASIISKEILCPDGESRDDHPFRVIDDTVVGTVPFYSPRTPGHVVFRLYWRENPVYTLGTSCTLRIRILENDFESSVRFILSNFKAKKVNPTSLSLLNSLSLVLESFQITSKKPAIALQHQFESAGRAVWGCVCESRKIIDACGIDHQRNIAKFLKLEEEVEELKERVAEEEKAKIEEKPDDKDVVHLDDESAEISIKSSDTSDISLTVALLREKIKALMGGRASNERKWRDSQLAFSSILGAVVKNPSISLLLRPDLIARLSLEFELWCPLCEEFATPQGNGDQHQQIWYRPLNKFSHPITNNHFRICNDARSKMQVKILGFIPNTTRLETILYSNRGNNRRMDPGAVGVFNQLSTSMGRLYQTEYFTADSILQEREVIRTKIENLVTMSECFPPGTKVAIFGSSANGYGSPNSDIDMCLQVPNSSSAINDKDATGAQAMATLAAIFEKNNMLDVDTSRLSARIPVIRFNCPRENDNGAPMECDLSMHNPLAVLNTSLLRTYAEINPVSRVMASIIKRWAKARDINNPARHTLSSYGYILMLLHFLTYHRKADDGLPAPMHKSMRSEVVPLLPNLQWMDSRWPGSAASVPYTEFREPPKQPMQHPREENVKVNSYFYRSSAPDFRKLQGLFPGQDFSLGILLASFFRYYAHDFDYKRHVVSLNSTKSYGMVQREVKAELDGWRNYSAALTIEDPFETFYDVAHVLRGGYYHRIRREFAVAYSKIADVATGKSNSSYNNRVVDLTKMSGAQLIEWICEPVDIPEREDALPSVK